MNEEEFAKKIVSVLNEVPLSNKVEDRLYNARQLALSRKKVTVERKGNTLALLWNQHIWSNIMLVLIGLMMLFVLSSSVTNYHKMEDDFDDTDWQILTDEHSMDFWLSPDIDNILKKGN